MPAVNVRYFAESASAPKTAVCMFDDEPFAAVVECKEKSGWNIFDSRQWSASEKAFIGEPRLGFGLSLEHGIRVAVAHAG